MRIATYNVEWFNRLFSNDGQLINDDSWSSRWDVTKARQTEALGTIFAKMNADAVMIIEAPDSSPNRDGETALQTFASAFGLRSNRALIGFPNDTQQEIALLYDPSAMKVVHKPLGGTADTPSFDQDFFLDVDVDAKPDPIRWSKPPLEVEVTLQNQKVLNLIGVHAKSKAPHGATEASEATRISIENRRKQLAQCIWLRRRVEQHLDQHNPLIVLGDFNDGPGLDEYEKLFGRSGVEIVLGEGATNKLFDPHARLALGSKLGAKPSTARFRRKDGPYLQALLDYIMVSEDLMECQPKWQIWHPFDHPGCFADPILRDALLDASDHFPVVLDIDL